MSLRQDIRYAVEFILDCHPVGSLIAAEAYKSDLLAGAALAQSYEGRAITTHDYGRVLDVVLHRFKDTHTHFDFLPEYDRKRMGHIDFDFNDTADGKWVVGRSGIPSIRTGSTIAGFDGRSVESCIAERVCPFARPALTAVAALRQRAQLLVDYGDSIRQRLQKIEFISDGLVHELDIEYVKPETLKRAVDSSHVKPLAINIDNIAFVRIPTFRSVGGNRQNFVDVAREVVALCARPGIEQIVFDLRGNTGGDSTIGIEMSSIIFGSALVNKAMATLSRPVTWRCSHRNLAHIQWLLDGGIDLSEAGLKWLRGVHRSMALGLNDGQDFVVENVVSNMTGYYPGIAAPTSPMVIIDGRCASATLDFIYLLKSMGPVTLLGEPSSAELLFTELNRMQLPSKAAWIYSSMKTSGTITDFDTLRYFEPDIKLDLTTMEINEFRPLMANIMRDHKDIFKYER